MYELEVAGRNVKSHGHTGSGHCWNHLLVPGFFSSLSVYCIKE